MKKIIKAGLLLLLCLLLLCQTGCSRGIRFTTGLGDSELFKLNTEVCESQEAYVFLLRQKKNYETVYSKDIWLVTVEGDTFDRYMSNCLIDFLARMKCMSMMAQEHGVVLLEEEEQRLLEAAKRFYAGLSQETIKATGITEESLRKTFSDYYLANKVMSELTKDVNTEISEDEARVIRVQQVFWSTQGLSEEAKQAACQEAQALSEGVKGSGSDLLLFSPGSGKISEFTLSRGEKEAVYEQNAFSLSTGEISQAFQTEKGYYVVRCINNYDEALTADNKVKCVRKRREDRFQEYYDEFLKTVVAEYNEKACKAISYGADYGSYQSDFYEIYEECLK